MANTQSPGLRDPFPPGPREERPGADLIGHVAGGRPIKPGRWSGRAALAVLPSWSVRAGALERSRRQVPGGSGADLIGLFAEGGRVCSGLSQWPGFVPCVRSSHAH